MKNSVLFLIITSALVVGCSKDSGGNKSPAAPAAGGSLPDTGSTTTSTFIVPANVYVIEISNGKESKLLVVSPGQKVDGINIRPFAQTQASADAQLRIIDIMKKERISEADLRALATKLQNRTELDSELQSASSRTLAKALNKRGTIQMTGESAFSQKDLIKAKNVILSALVVNIAKTLDARLAGYKANLDAGNSEGFTDQLTKLENNLARHDYLGLKKILTTTGDINDRRKQLAEFLNQNSSNGYQDLKEYLSALNEALHMKAGKLIVPAGGIARLSELSQLHNTTVKSAMDYLRDPKSQNLGLIESSLDELESSKNVIHSNEKLFGLGVDPKAGEILTLVKSVLVTRPAQH